MAHSNRRLHFKDVDGLRFYAFLPVFVFCFFKHLSFDQEGVFVELANVMEFFVINSLDLFFCLSAFLITSHGLREYKYTDGFSFRNFLLRRLMRMALPLLLLLLFIFFGHPWLISTLKLQPISVPDFKAFASFLPNYFSRFNNEQFVYLAVTWTIFMFIQSSVLLGIVVRFFKTMLVPVSVILVLGGITARIIHVATDTAWQFDTASYGVPIGVGILVAHLIRSESKLIEKIKKVPKRLNAIIYSAAIIAIVSGYVVATDGYLLAFVPVITSLCFGYSFIEQTFGKNSLFKIRNSRLISHLGKISFGLIVYQSMISVLVLIAMGALDLDLSSDMLRIVGLLASFVLTWIVADVSYNLLERPLLILRKEFKKA